MLPAAVGGPQAGELSVGYYRTVNGVLDPNDTNGHYTYTVAQSTNANSAQPTFTYSDVNPGFVYHKGQICNAGILCGLPGQPSDRSLLDFTSAVIDTRGCPIYTFAGNPSGDNTVPADNYVTRQTSNCFATPAGFAGSQAGGVQVPSKAKTSVKRKAARCTTAKHRSKKHHTTHGRTRAHTAATCKTATKHKTAKKKHPAKKRSTARHKH
jgi:hypothetical protein